MNPTKEDLQRSKRLGYDNHGNETVLTTRELGVGMPNYGTSIQYCGDDAVMYNREKNRLEPWHCDSEGHWEIDAVWNQGFETIPGDEIWYNGTLETAIHAIRTLGNYHESWTKHTDGRWRRDVD